jgi:hypothetical protein
MSGFCEIKTNFIISSFLTYICGVSENSITESVSKGFVNGLGPLQYEVLHVICSEGDPIIK